MRLAFSAMALALTGCASNMASDSSSPLQPSVSADLRDATGRSTGSASAVQVGDTIRIRIDAAGLPGGVHGVHVHQVGLCTPPGFESAGPHWNPGGLKHGKDNPGGMHKGDLPNIAIGGDGRGALEYTISAASISGAMLDADGAALVVHFKADDYRTDPSGNSGARIACGVFR